MTLADSNNYDTTTQPQEFLPGITYSVITNSNPNVSDAPEQTNGTLITNKPLLSGFSLYTTQEYLPVGSNAKYIRNAVNQSSWGNWIKIEGQII